MKLRHLFLIIFLFLLYFIIKTFISTVDSVVDKDVQELKNQNIKPSTTQQKQQISTKSEKEKAEPSTVNRVVEEKNEAIGKPVFGIQLGENVAELKKRYSINPILANKDERQINKVYIVENKFPEVKDLRVQCFNDKIYEIDVFLRDINRSNFNDIVEQIKNKYNILKQTVKNDKSYQLGNTTQTILEYEFLVRFDDEDVVISPLIEEASDRVGETLAISYTYERLNALVENEYRKMSSREKENEHKNREASKKRLSDQL